ncbi:ORF1060 [White spot syndrome virus]|uniref:ORF1060 n=1 Tax=White spot syndrome virus TaxID=342409 RepID=A0A2D3I720_9VIRU|nr:ORF1060 [White spot syndrome virus]
MIDHAVISSSFLLHPFWRALFITETEYPQCPTPRYDTLNLVSFRIWEAASSGMTPILLCTR